MFFLAGAKPPSTNCDCLLRPFRIGKMAYQIAHECSSRYAPASVLGVGFGYLNTFSQSIWSTRIQLVCLLGPVLVGFCPSQILDIVGSNPYRIPHLHKTRNKGE